MGQLQLGVLHVPFHKPPCWLSYQILQPLTLVSLPWLELDPCNPELIREPWVEESLGGNVGGRHGPLVLSL